MTNDTMKWLFIAGGGLFLFWLVKPRPQSARINDDASATDPAMQKKNAQTALTAYMAAVKDGTNAAGLEELNRMIQSEYNLRVYQKRSDGRYYVADTRGNDILKG